MAKRTPIGCYAVIGLVTLIAMTPTWAKVAAFLFLAVVAIGIGVTEWALSVAARVRSPPGG